MCSSFRIISMQPPLQFTTPDTDYWPEIPAHCGESSIILNAETTGVDWRTDRVIGISYWYPASGRHGYLSVRHPGSPNVDAGALGAWLRDVRGMLVVNANTRFDLHMLRTSEGVDLTTQGNIFGDVQHQAALLDDQRRTLKLDDLSRDLLEWDVTQSPLGKLPAGMRDEGEFQHAPASVVAPYAIRNVEQVDRLAKLFSPRLSAEDLGRVLALEQAIIPVVVEMEKHGLPLDMDLLTAWEAQTRQLLERLQWALYRECGFACNPDSAKDMTRLFHSVGAPISRTETGAPSFTAEIVKAQADQHTAIRLAYRVGKLQDLRSKSFVKYLGDAVNGHLYPSFNQLPVETDGTGLKGTRSGRFSSSNPNGQNILGADKYDREYGWLAEYLPEPLYTRKLFRPKTGSWLCADMAQIEFRLFVDYSGSERLLQAYRDDPTTNFHKYVKTHIIDPVKPNLTHTEVKVFNFTGIYGGGVGAAARILKVPNEEALEPYEAYHEAFPEAKTLLHRAQRVAETRGYVRTRLGRRTRFPGRPGQRERTHKALNAVIQGTAADLNKLYLLELYKERQRLGLTLRATVHDEVDGDLDGPLTAVQELLSSQLLPLRVPVLWDAHTAATWHEAK
jgi:DNA polymerase-1